MEIQSQRGIPPNPVCKRKELKEKGKSSRRSAVYALYPFEHYHAFVNYSLFLQRVLPISVFYIVLLVALEGLLGLFCLEIEGDLTVDYSLIRGIFLARVVTDPSIENRGCDCVAGLECLLNIIRALKMGSCLSSESRSPLPNSPTATLGVRKRKSSRKRPGSRNSSFDYRREEQLHRVPGRMFLNGSSDVASMFTQQGKKGTNQDAMIVWENFGSRTDTVFCGVFDGHGPYGHMVAKRVRDSLPLKLSAHWEVNIKSDDVLRGISLNTTGSMRCEETSFISADEESRASIDVEETEKQAELFQTLKESFLKAFKVMDRELRMYTNIDCFCSGTTAVTMVKQGQDLVIGNVGDSRAILGTRDKDNSLIPVQLTVDLKPNLPGLSASLYLSLFICLSIYVCILTRSRVYIFFNEISAHCLDDPSERKLFQLILPKIGSRLNYMYMAAHPSHYLLLKSVLKNFTAEAERIRKCRGRVFALQDEPEVARVWLPNNDSPGLAMARAFGDFCLKDFGLISVPEISYRRLTEKDEFVVLATDGIWDVLTNKEVVDIVASAPAHSFAARALVESAVRAWRCKYPTSKVDDCAVVCLFFDSDSNNVSTASTIKTKDKIASEHIILSSEKEDLAEPTGLNRSGTVRTGQETVGEERNEESVDGGKEEAGVNAEWGKDWSALDGVSRVNTLLTLPRFVPGKEEKHSGAGTKTHK
ncbi:hypothetical protein RJ639_017877 [Escallonia herrerae]|uniref:PPM-type phosphatase domain-containing protein n=1 Tax=Escallonia herrerae TaxID=1293975 RepID=A0AA89AHX2_9ASTE|nr:hypothetical protein RJ639_017877 [Escallonia herrerae]